MASHTGRSPRISQPRRIATGGLMYVNEPMRPALVRPSAKLQVAKPSALGTAPRYTVQSSALVLASPASSISVGEKGRHATVAAVAPSQVTWNGVTRASTVFWTTTANEYADAATRQSAIPSPASELEPVVPTP